MAAGEGDAPDHAGHRDRLRARLFEAGPGALADYELLEVLLFAATPRQDTKAVAKALIDRFGGLVGVFNADPKALRQVKGVGESAIGILKIVPAAAARMLEREVAERPVLNSWQKVLDYCRVAMAHAPVEEFRILFLDRKNMLIRAEIQQRGTVDQTPVYPREVVKRALELGASALILVHNHPSGDPTPSRADIDMTRAVAEAARSLGIDLHDHLVIGRHGHTSLKGLGHL